MADIASMTISVNAVAEQAETVLENLAETLKDVAKQGEKKLRVNVDAGGLKQARTAAQGLGADMAAVGRAMDAITQKPMDVKKMVEDYNAQAEAGNRAWLANLARRQQQQAEMVAQRTQAATAEIAAGTEQASRAVEQAATQAKAALAQTGEAGRQAGAQVEKGGEQGAKGIEKLAPAAKAASVALSGMQRLGVAVVNGLVGGLVGGLTSRLIGMVLDPLEKWITGLVHLKEEQEKARQESARGSREAADEYMAMAGSIREMAARYGELSRKKRSASEDQAFLNLQSALAEALGTTTDAINSQASSLDAWAQAADSAAKIQAGLAAQEYERAANELLISAREKGKAAEKSRISSLDWQGRERLLAEAEAAYEALFTTRMDVMQARLAEKGVAMGDDLKAVLGTAFQNAFTMDRDTFGKTAQSGLSIDEWAERMYTQSADAINALLESGRLTDAVVGYNGLTQKVLYGEMTPEEAVAQAQGYGDELLAVLVPFFETFGNSAGEANAAAAGLIRQLVNPELVQSGDGLLAYLQGIAQSADGLDTAKSAFEALDGGAKALVGDYGELLRRFNDTTAPKKAANEWKALRKEYDALQKEGKSTQSTVDKLNRVLKATGSDAKVAGKSMGELDAYMAGVETAADSAGEQFVADVQGMISSLESYRDQLAAEGVMGSVDNSQAIEAINQVIRLLNALLTLSVPAGIDLNGKGRGGGGGGRKDSAEEEAKEAERLRKEALQRDYELIAHRRHLNQISLEEELAALEELRRRHRMNAEEIMDWEEKIYDLKREIRGRDAGNLDNLSDGVLDALESRYQAMLDAEVERLDASRDAWEKWRDDSVKAIEDQIAALDRLADTENREKKDQEELRKLAKLRQQIEFEQDAYNRAKLEQQLEQAVQSREERLRKLALEDEKAALREQLAGIEQRADDELAALDKEQEAIERAYEERMKTAALRAEAEKLILTQSQAQILQLLNDYAPDYNATGETLGEKLLEGFERKVGGIADWFESFNEQIAAAQARLAATAQAAADGFYRGQAEREGAQGSRPPTVVNQTVNINQPVETPGQMARRMEQVNEALALML